MYVKVVILKVRRTGCYELHRTCIIALKIYLKTSRPCKYFPRYEVEYPEYSYLFKTDLNQQQKCNLNYNFANTKMSIH